MTYYTSFGQYARVFNRRVSKLKKADKRSVKKATNFIFTTAKHIAPEWSGETRRGIRRRIKKGNVGIVESVVSKKGGSRFMQNFWVDEEHPWETASGRSYRSVKKTGTPRFFKISARMGKKVFRKLLIKYVSHAMR